MIIGDFLQSGERHVLSLVTAMLHSIKPESENKIKLYSPDYFTKSVNDFD